MTIHFIKYFQRIFKKSMFAGFSKAYNTEKNTQILNKNTLKKGGDQPPVSDYEKRTFNAR
jgi:hypothetical protein